MAKNSKLLFQSLYKKAKLPLAKGVAPKNIRMIWTRFSTLLERKLDSVYHLGATRPDRTARRAGNDLIELVSSAEPNKRLEIIERELVGPEIYRLDNIARSLGTKWLSLDSLPLEERLECERIAATIKDRLLELYTSLRDKYPALVEYFEWEFSEGTLDCEYVLGESDGAMSLRLGRAYEDLRRAQRMFDAGHIVDANSLRNKR